MYAYLYVYLYVCIFVCFYMSGVGQVGLKVPPYRVRTWLVRRPARVIKMDDKTADTVGKSWDSNQSQKKRFPKH